MIPFFRNYFFPKKYLYQTAPDQENLILKLPEEVQYKVFTYLLPKELANAALVCRKWRSLSEDSTLWKKNFKNIPPQFKDPKKTASFFYGQFPKKLKNSLSSQINLADIPVLSDNEASEIENKRKSRNLLCNLCFNYKWAIWRDRNNLIHLGIRSYTPESRSYLQWILRERFSSSDAATDSRGTHYFLHFFQSSDKKKWNYSYCRVLKKPCKSDCLPYEKFKKIIARIEKLVWD